jgi:hypothetical protein
MVSFDQNNLVEPHLPFSTPFQIRVRVNSRKIYRCIVDEGSYTSIFSSLAWKYFGSSNIVSSTSELLDFNRRPSECLGIVPQFPIILGGKNVLIDLSVMPGPLDFNMILGCDYVYVMNVVVSTLFRVMHFPHKIGISTIDHLSYDNLHPHLDLAQVSPLYVPSVQVESSPPRVNYVVSYPEC